jgi:glycosyltransferase involved in cell wall biosynthesis
MRILHVMNNLSDRGNGIVNLAVDLAIEQRKAGHAVALASGCGGYESLLQMHGITHYDLDFAPSARRLLAASSEFRRILRSFQPDIIHAHMRMGLLIAWLWTRVARIPLVAHLHNVHDKSSILMGLADRIIAVSLSVSKSMQRQGIGRSKLRVVLNGTLNSERAAQQGVIIPAALQRPAITTVAGMNHRKGIEELILAFNMIAEEFTGAHLYLVGDGPERKLFEQQADQSPFRDRIHFEGFQRQPQAYMLSSDIFVLASRRESFGLVLTEAREAGCAIVASDIDGTPEALEVGEAGMLIPARNPAALANALRLLLGDGELRRDWQKKARQNIEAFTTTRMAEEVEKIYRELAPSSTDKTTARGIKVRAQE